MCESFTVICHITFNQRNTLSLCNRVLLRRSSAKTGRSENNAFTLQTIQSSCYLRFSRCFSKYIPLKFRLVSTNELRLFSKTRHTGVKKKCHIVCCTRLIRTPRYYGQFSLSLGKESPYIISKFKPPNTDNR